MAEKLENKTRVGKHALSLLERAVIKIESDAKALIFYKGHECAASYLKIISTLVETEEIDDRQYESLFSGKKPFFVFQGVLRKEFYIDKEKGFFYLKKAVSQFIFLKYLVCLMQKILYLRKGLLLSVLSTLLFVVSIFLLINPNTLPCQVLAHKLCPLQGVF